MKPKLLAVLKNLTVPLIMIAHDAESPRAEVREAAQQLDATTN